MRNLNEQKFSDMIHAFSAGCLDREECLEFLEYLKSGQKVRENELGELQNVVSLLPAMLELERPEVELKDRVAKRLYRMREELREKRKQSQKDFPSGEISPANENAFSEKLTEALPPLKTTGRMTVETPLPGREPSGRDNSALKKSTIVEVPYTEADKTEGETAGVPASRETGSHLYKTMEAFVPEAPHEESAPEEPIREEPDLKEPSAAELNRKEPFREKRPAEEITREEEETKSGSSLKSILLMSALLVVLLIAGGITYFLMNRQIGQGKEQIASLSGQVNALNSEMLRLDRNQKVLAVLSAKDLKTINLDGTASNSGGFGKLALLQNGSEGVIQLYNMPALKDSSVYELWLQSGKNYYSLGTFRTKREVEYFPFSVPQTDQGKIDSYIVTLETGEGKTTPSDKIYLMTSFNGK